MFSVADFISKYDKYTDEELMEIHNSIDNYSNEAKEALDIVISKKGGIDRLLKSIADKKLVDEEISRIEKETKELGSKGVDASFIKTTTSSTVLSTEEVSKIIDQQYREVESEIKDKQVNARTIAGSFVGGGIASIAGGILLGVSMIYTNRVIYFLVAGLAILCYFAIKAATRQSKNNLVVLLATFISVILAFIIAQLLYSNPSLIGLSPQ